MKYLNLGCGSKLHPAWINVDMYATNEFVIACNFLDGIPFEDSYFDVVYHSHVLEHFSPEKGLQFVKECCRVLKPGGIIRMVLPDLERIICEYQKNMTRFDKNDAGAEYDYDWILLELYDQAVRNRSGGEMIKYLNDLNIKNKAYVTHRVGEIMDRPISTDIALSTIKEIEKLKLVVKTRQKSNSSLFKKLEKLKDRILLSLLSDYKKEIYRVGEFRNNGEVHQWMYDQYSIKRLLERGGFHDIKIRTAIESYIKDWGEFQLDNPQENVSLFVEAIKPHSPGD